MNENIDLRPRSISDALMQCRDLQEHLEGYSLNKESLPADLAKRMSILAGWLDPEGMAQNLAAALRTLWCAVKSGELAHEDQVNALWLMSEWAETTADAVYARQELENRLHHDEQVRAKQKKAPRKRT
ncbi:MAG TPA: hypothetical protein ENI99_04010 [Sedimenticola sp.]|nr:hypothetical protein [Sedimenticola sp.]